jgi:type VI protein secretion system component VasK
METRKTMIQLRIAWLWIKKNWKLAALAVWSVFVWFVSRKNSQGAIDAMNANKESYEAQIESLREQHKVEIKKREELHLKYRETLARIEEKYKKKEEELSIIEKKKVKEIIKKTKDNPDEINKKIEDLFGFVSDS